MVINIEGSSGFCYGVVRVINIAEELLRKGEEIWCLGQIVHNEAEVERLTELGMKFIDHEKLHTLKNSKLLIRAHGEPPSTYDIARKNNLQIIEGTCPIVRRLQKKVHTSFSIANEEEEMVIIFGKAEHPEVIGLKGQTDNLAVVIKSPEEAETIPLKKKISLFSQTTMSESEYEIVAEILKKRVAKYGGELSISNSICGHVSRRKPGLEKFAAENDVIIFVGGKNSSNAKSLYKICKLVNLNTYFVSHFSEINKEWFKDARTTGLCGATSTPEWQLKEIAEKIRILYNCFSLKDVKSQ